MALFNLQPQEHTAQPLPSGHIAPFVPLILYVADGIVTQRYEWRERLSVLITSNLVFSRWRSDFQRSGDHGGAHGLPIATGVIEGACRHLIKDRIGHHSRAPGLDSAEAILKLRSLQNPDLSDDETE